MRAATHRPFHVSFTILHEPAHLAVCIEERVPIVSFHLDVVSADTVATLHDGEVDVCQQVGSVAAAHSAVQNGVDVIVAQGYEAGGHNRGGLPLFVLVPEVRAAIGDVLLLAAGAISSGRSVAAALAPGADGVWVGSRLVATEEADAQDEWKRRLLAATGTGSVLTSVFGPAFPAFNPMRVLGNAVVRDRDDRAWEIPADTIAGREVGELVICDTRLKLRRFDCFPPTAASSGDFEELPLLAGQGVGMIGSIVRAGDLVASMIADAEAVIGALAGGRSDQA